MVRKEALKCNMHLRVKKMFEMSGSRNVSNYYSTLQKSIKHNVYKGDDIQAS